jgi:DNA-binding PucR family transcriptional regulator
MSTELYAVIEDNTILSIRDAASEAEAIDLYRAHWLEQMDQKILHASEAVANLIRERQWELDHPRVLRAKKSP